MRIFVAGGTGVLGRRVVPRLVRLGHDVHVVTRSVEKAAQVGQQGAKPVGCDLFDPKAVRRAVAGSEAVLNLATHIPPPAKAAWPSAWRENERVRRVVSRHLVDAALEGSVERYGQESVVFAYPDFGQEWIDEDVPLDPLPFAAAVVEAEAQARRFTAAGRDGVVLRFGMFYGPDALHAQAQDRAARQGFSPFIGRREGYVSPVHLDDAAEAVVHAIQAPAGTYNIVDDRPVTRAELDAVLAHGAGRSRLKAFPASLTRMMPAPLRLLARSQRVTNARFRVTGWKPRYESIAQGWTTVSPVEPPHVEDPAAR